MQTGIIYQAFNKISGKSYIGQTINNLKQRIYDHYYSSKTRNYKFPTALRKYNKEDWEWIILIEVELDKLDDYEKYYIDLFNSCKNGYNTHIGGNIKGENGLTYNPTIYELWHPEHGEIRETISQLTKRHPSFPKCIQYLARGELKYIHGYVLLKNKKNYDELLKIHKFYHPKHGTVKCTLTQLDKKYLQIYDSKYARAKSLVKGIIYMYHGWVLDENKDNYENINLKNKNRFRCKVTLHHPIHGTLSMRMFEFYEQYNLLIPYIQKLKRKEIDNINGWKLVK